MAELADGLTYDPAELDRGASRPRRRSLAVDAYVDWFATLPDDARDAMSRPCGDRRRATCTSTTARWCSPGSTSATCSSRSSRRAASAPTRSPRTTRPTSRRRTTTSRSTAGSTSGWGADAIVHLGKHGTLEWLPGKALALSAGCWPDAALGDVPLFYPFVVNDPGEGTQAKRRAHAVVIDHLLPPMTRADTYDELARLEQLFDEYAQVRSLDPSKLPALRDQIWELLVERRSTATSGSASTPTRTSFDDVIAPRRRLPVRAQGRADPRRPPHPRRAPDGEALVDLVLAITRLPQGAIPSLRATVAAELGVDLDDASRASTRRVEDECREPRRARSPTHGWDPEHDGRSDAALGRRLARARRCAARRDEIDNLLPASPGRHVPPGPSGAPTRGGAHVLPTGRNFYSLDPKALPSGWRGRSASRSPTASSRATSPRTAATRPPSGWCSGAPRPCARRATTSPRRWRCSASARVGAESRRSPASR